MGALVAAVLWLHTRSSTQHTTVPSSFLWARVQAVLPVQSDQRRPTVNSAFWLQALFVLLLALALSQPFVGGTGPIEDHLIIVVDASTSMGTVDSDVTRFETAVDAAFGLAKSFLDTTPGGKVSVVEASAHPYIAAAFFTRVEDVREAFHGLGPPDQFPRGIAWDEVARRVETLASSDSNRIVVVTDGAGEDPSVYLAPIMETNALEFIQVGSASSNVALANWSLISSDDGVEWLVVGEVLNFSNEVRTVSVELRFQSEGASSFLDWAGASVELAPGESEFVEIELGQLPAGVIEVRVPDDALASDNRVLLTVGPPSPPRVLLVGPVDPHLEALVRTWQDAMLFREEQLPAVTSEYDLVIVNGLDVNGLVATHMLRFGTAQEAPAGPVQWIESPTLTGWLDHHPLARGIDWTHLHVDRAMVTPRLPGAHVVLESGGIPLIQARLGDAGVEVFVAFTLDDTNWVRLPSFPMFFDNLRRWMRESPPIGTSVTGAWPEFLVEELDVRPRAWLDALGVQGNERALPLARWILLVACVVLILETFVSGVVRVSRGHGANRSDVRLARGVWPFALRVCSMLAIATTLIGNPWPSKALDISLVAIVDESAADRGGTKPGEILDALPARQRPELLGIVSVGPGVRVMPMPGGSPEEAPSAHVPSTDLELALEMALSLVPPAGRGDVLFFSDGVETRGRSLNVLSRYRDRGVPIHVIPQPSRPPGDALVERVVVPDTAWAKSRFALHATIFSQAGGNAIVRFLRDGDVIAADEVLLQPGRNRIEADFMEQDAGEVLYEVEVMMPNDPISENNRDGALVRIEDSPRVAVIAERRTDAEAFGRALELQGIDIDVILPHMVPWEPEDWHGFDAAVLLNLPAIELHSRQQSHLERFVRDLGGGLVVLGGENSFGPGGYYQTALEGLSPLSSRIEQEAPSIAMLFVLDKSGSMNQQENGVARLTIAKEATLTAIELLGDESMAGVVVFDSDARMLVPVQPVTERDSFEDGLASLTAGGGTAIYPGLVAAYEALGAVDAMTAHIVLMTDGLSSPGDFDEIVGRITEDEITISTVAIGAGADSLLLRRIARDGNGMAHVTTDWEALPSILAQEALLSSAAFIAEEEVRPHWSRPRPDFLRGMPDSLPPVHGVVRTTAKPNAQVYLSATVADEEVPLLAGWQYGLGRVVAFASHGLGPWAEGWSRQSWFPRLWSQVVRWTATPGMSAEVEFTLKRDRDELVIEIGFLSPVEIASALHNEEHLSVHVQDPSGDVTPVRLVPAGPGTYEGRMPALMLGVYRALFGEMEAAAFVSYPAKMRTTLDADAVLETLAAGTSGTLSLEPADITFSVPRNRWVLKPGFVPWTLVSLLLFLAALAAPIARRRAMKFSTQSAGSRVQRTMAQRVSEVVGLK